MILTQRTVPSSGAGARCGAAAIWARIAPQFAAPPVAHWRSNRGSLRHVAVNPLATAPSSAAQATPARRLGVFELLALLGKSQRSMLWRVRDLRRMGAQQEPQLLLLPRAQPDGAVAAGRWDDAVRRAARLEHPNLAQPREIGTCEHWPYLLYDTGGAQTLAERLGGSALAAQEAAMLCMQALRGLAFAHDGGVVHGDLQPFMLLRAEHQPLRIIGLELTAHTSETRGAVHTSIDALQLAAQREAAQRDALSMGLMLHWMLAGRAPLDEPDVGVQLERLAPSGRDIVRLPWSTALPVPQALRAIADRASERQPRQRYRSARSMERALDGWLRSEAAAGGGPLALLMDRLHSAGALPTMPGGEGRAARLAAMDHERTSELAQVVLQDLALSFELLRCANRTVQHAALSAGNGPVLTVRRAIAVLGMDGVRRATLGLRPWPGALSAAAALSLGALIEDTRRAARAAQALRPPGYDAEVVQLVTLLQNLGRLLSAYHFPDEWQQIRRLVQPEPAARKDGSHDAGMTEQAASCAVLGVELEGFAIAVARHWGLDETVLHLVRRMPLATPPRTIDNDDDMLRAVASCAHEAIDALAGPTELQDSALRRVIQRYGRALGLRLEDLKVVLDEAGRGAAAFPSHHEDTADAR